MMPNSNHTGRTFTAATVASHQHSSIEVELTISARNLSEKEDLTKPDTLCVVYNHPFGRDRDWQEYARTEIQRSTFNPLFTNKIKIPYTFEEQQKLRFHLYDIDSSLSSRSLSQQELLGRAECNLGEIISGHTRTMLLTSSNGEAELIVTANQASQNRGELELTFEASGLKKSTLANYFVPPDPFLDIVSCGTSNSSGGGSPQKRIQLLKRTLCLSATRNPNWPSICLPLKALKNSSGDYCTLSMQCYHFRDDGDHLLIGEAQIQARQLLEAPVTFNLKKNNMDRGEVTLSGSRIRPIYSFLEYIFGGTRLHCTFAIDLTASNGDPHNPESLHYLGPEPTAYEHAIKAIADIIKDYVGNKEMFSLLGFGARSTPVCHELHVQGLEAVLQAYRASLQTVELGEDSRAGLAPTIEQFARRAKDRINGDDYFILVLLTDGDVADLVQTNRAIIEASELPISIVVVGIGQNSDFNTLLALAEGDQRAKRENQQQAARQSILQFAPFGHFLAERSDVATAKFDLARFVLADIPDQMVAWMKLKDILPKNRKESHSKLALP